MKKTAMMIMMVIMMVVMSPIIAKAKEITDREMVAKNVERFERAKWFSEFDIDLASAEAYMVTTNYDERHMLKSVTEAFIIEGKVYNFTFKVLYIGNGGGIECFGERPIFIGEKEQFNVIAYDYVYYR